MITINKANTKSHRSYRLNDIYLISLFQARNEKQRQGTFSKHFLKRKPGACNFFPICYRFALFCFEGSTME